MSRLPQTLTIGTYLAPIQDPDQSGPNARCHFYDAATNEMHLANPTFLLFGTAPPKRLS